MDWIYIQRYLKIDFGVVIEVGVECRLELGGEIEEVGICREYVDRA